MNVLQLPNDILFLIIEEMNMDVLPLVTVNKELQELSKERVEKEHAKHIAKETRKTAYIAKLRGGVNMWWDGFHGVSSIEECDILRELYKKEYGDITFMSRVRYTSGNTFQIAAETWHRYLQIHAGDST